MRDIIGYTITGIGFWIAQIGFKICTKKGKAFIREHVYKALP